MQASSVLPLNILVELYFGGRKKEMRQDKERTQGYPGPLDWAKSIWRPQLREMGNV